MFMFLAQEESAQIGDLLGTLIPLLLIGAFVWFAMIRPQRKRQRETQQMQDRLAIGDPVVTIGGLHGIVETKTDATVDLLVDADEDTVLRFKRSAIAEILREPEPEMGDTGGNLDTESP